MKNLITLLTITIVTFSCEETHEIGLIHSELQVQQIAHSEQIVPTFPGGHAAYKEFLAENIKYPSEAVEENIEGQVIVAFTVDKSGKSKGIKVLQGLGYGCDKEAIRVIKLIKNWQPASAEGESIEVEMAQRIIFRINGDSGPASKPVAITQS